MATLVLVVAILGLYSGGFAMAAWSRRAALLDTRISIAIGHRFFAKQMRRRWGSHEDFKRYLTSKKILSVYKATGILAIIVASGLTIFLLTIA